MATFSNRDTIKAGIAAKMAANRDARAAAKANAREINSLQRRGVGPISAGPGPIPPTGGGPISAGPGALPPYIQGGATGGMGGGPISAGPGALPPSTTTFQGGATGGMGGGMGGGMPDKSMLPPGAAFKKGGKAKVKKMASGGMTSNSSPASTRADGIAQRGKTKCKIC